MVSQNNKISWNLRAKTIVLCLALATVPKAVVFGQEPGTGTETGTPEAAKEKPKALGGSHASPRDVMKSFLTKDSLSAADVMLFGEDENLDAKRRLALVEKLRYILKLNRKVAFEELPDAAGVRENAITSYKVCDVAQMTLTGSRILGEFNLVRLSDGRWFISTGTTSRIEDWYEILGPGFLEKHLPTAFLNKFLDIALWQYSLLLIYIFIGLLVRKITSWTVSGRLKNWAAKTKFTWDDKLVELATTPFSFLVMSLAWLGLIRTLGLPEPAFSLLNMIVKASVIIGVSWLFYRLADVFSEYLMSLAQKTDSKLDDQLVPIARKSMKVFVIIIGLLFVLQNFRVDIWSLLAGLGLGGLAVALAAQDTVKNLFGSVMIFIDRPFQIGDWIKAGDVEGNIEEVGFRSTRIRTFAKSLITIPNSLLANMNIENMTARPRQRIKTWLGVEYGTSPEQLEWLVGEIRGKIMSNDKFAHDYMQVWFTDFGPSSLNIMIYCYVLGGVWADFLEQRQWLYLEIIKLCRRQGINFAFPTQTLHIETLAKMRESEPDYEHFAALQLPKATGSMPPSSEEKPPRDGADEKRGAEKGDSEDKRDE